MGVPPTHRPPRTSGRSVARETACHAGLFHYIRNSSARALEMNLTPHSRRLTALVAIEKTGSVTLGYLLRRHFGWRHIDVAFRQPDPLLHIIYTPRDLRIDLRLYPFAQSLAGHSLRPFVDFEEFESRLVWCTVLRDPVSRYISHYQYMVKTYGQQVGDFRAWLRRPRPRRLHNWQVRKLAGNEDLEAAKQILAARFRCVGLLEHFHQSLLIICDRLGLKGFNVRYSRPLNVAKENELRRQIMERFDEYRNEIMENNELDTELYAFVLKEIWPKQVAEYGEERLENDIKVEFQGGSSTVVERWRWSKGFVYRNLVYKPFVWLDRRWNRGKNADRTDRPAGSSGKTPLRGDRNAAGNPQGG